MSGSTVIITSPGDDGDGIVATTPRVKVTIEYTPGDDESPAQIARTIRRLQRRADDIAEDFAE